MAKNSKSRAAKAAAKGKTRMAPTSDLHELMPEVPKPRAATDFVAMIRKTSEETGLAVRVEYRFERGWIVAVGGKVIGEIEGDPATLLGDAAKEAIGD